MQNRLAEIKARWGMMLHMPRETKDGLDDVAWLVGEVERLSRQAEEQAAVCTMLVEAWDRMTPMDDAIDAARKYAL